MPGSAVGPGQGSGSAVGPVLPLDVTNEESFPSLTPSADRKTPQAGLNFRLAVQKNIAVPKQGLNGTSKQGLNSTSLEQGIIRDSMSLNGMSLNGTSLNGMSKQGIIRDSMSLNNMFLNPHAHAHAHAHSHAHSHAYSHAYSDDYPDADTDAYDSAYTKYYND